MSCAKDMVLMDAAENDRKEGIERHGEHLLGKVQSQHTHLAPSSAAMTVEEEVTFCERVGQTSGSA